MLVIPKPCHDPFLSKDSLTHEFAIRMVDRGLAVNGLQVDKLFQETVDDWGLGG